MVGPQDSGLVREGLLEQGDGVLDPACCLVGVGEVVACGQGVGVVWSQDAGAVSKGLFVQGDGVMDPACRLLGAGKITSCCKGVRVVWVPITSAR